MKERTRDWTEWHVAAAAESEFAPGDLAESPEDVGPIVAALQNDIAVVPTKAGPRWTLKRDVRQAVLNERQDEVTRKAHGDGPLHQVLRGEDPELESLDAVALTAYLDASWTVQGTPFARPDATQRARALLGRRKILEPFQKLIGGHFRGREPS